jgi:hypothetical protein
MGTLGESIATRLEQANAEIIRAVESISDERWTAPCPDDGRQINVVAHHVAASHTAVAGIVQLAAQGGPMPPITMDDIHQGNAAHAQEQAGCSKAETLELLRTNGAAAAAMVRGLSDEQFQRSVQFMGGDTQPVQIAENILIGHVTSHLAALMAPA